jgi:Fe-S-cluster containining protein
MAIDPIKLPVLAQAKEDEDLRFRVYLKSQDRMKEEQVDELVFELTKQVWAGIDCTQCANCCKTVRPTLSDEDVDRLVRRLGTAREEFIRHYLEPTEPGDDNPWQTNSTPCPFLKDNLCSVYEDRPTECRKYPYLYEPDFTSRTIGMVNRTFQCPIVYEVMKKLKRAMGFRRRKRP